MPYLPTVKNTVKYFTVIFILTLFSQTSFAQLSFNNPVLVSGTDLKEGAVYRYDNVTGGVNAFVKIDSIVNGSRILRIDDYGVGYLSGFQPAIQPGDEGISYVLFTIDFVNAHTGAAFYYGALNSNILDIDGNNSVKEFAEFSAPGAAGFYLSNAPQINIKNSANKTYIRNVSGIAKGNIDTSNKEVMTQVTSGYISSIKVKFGTIAEGKSNGLRNYSLFIKNYALTAPLPVTLTSFQALLKNNSSELAWSTTSHTNFSHFVVEKSTNGKDFSEAAVLFADANSDNSYTFNYSFKDNLQNNTSSVIYYRLKMVDIDSKYSYSEIRMVRLAAVNDSKIKITTFPNPVTNEVRVSIPTEWQEKQVLYEVYNSNGTLVQRVNNTKAAQVQQINVSSLNAGTYIVKVSNGSETSTSKIIKAN